MENTLVFKLDTVEHSTRPEDGGEATLAASYDRRQCRPTSQHNVSKCEQSSWQLYSAVERSAHWHAVRTIYY